MSDNATTGYRYFVSFTCYTESGMEFRNTELVLRRPICRFEDVYGLSNLLARKGHQNPVILGFSRFDDMSASTDARPTPNGATS